jgi:hypothetical protein
MEQIKNITEKCILMHFWIYKFILLPKYLFCMPNYRHDVGQVLCIMYRAIKLICNRVIHESEIVCRFLNKKHSLKHKLDLGISIEKTYGFKSMDDSITN